MHPAQTPMDSILAALELAAAERPDAPAVVAAGGPALTYAQLLEAVVRGGTELCRRGIGPGDRVACVVPQGVDAALAFLTIAAWTGCAPFNPALGVSELLPLLEDLAPRALVLPAAAASPAADTAARLTVPVITIDALWGGQAGQALPERPGAGDVALLLHTSGTTSRPKLVPLTRHNLLVSAANIARTLELSAADRALNVMPLFHIHGLVGVLLSTLVSRGSVVCPSAISGALILDALEQSGATWYSAVPTLHQAVLDEVRARRGPPRHRLRLIRSSSSALPPQVMASLEETFGVPVIEAYGMTEASHQMASNPLPPRPRKAASVGIPAGPEMAVLDPEGNLLPRNTAGEIAIRGESVTRGYESNPEANAKSFTGGWFRTGDEGYFDDDGYLFLTGRLKEMINRGGEKVAPVEIDRVLLDHPAVAQAVAYALPHPRLGEDVGAAVVLRPGALATELELRMFARERLAAFKVPSVVTIVESIPKGATGKIQRIGLAERLTVSRSHSRPPGTALERRVAAVWSELLGIEDPGAADPFFFSGGDSIVAAQLIGRLQQAFGIELEMDRFFDRPTIEELAAMVERRLIEKLASLDDDQAAALLEQMD